MLPSSAFSFLALTAFAAATPLSLEDRQSGNFKAEMISAHNFFRGQHSAKPLTWSDGLAKKAQGWANKCKFSHDSPGENLAAGSGFTSWGGFVNLWGAERKKYNYNKPGFSQDTGHFTQVVWKNTRQVGCGWKKCNGGQGLVKGFYIVCKYDPYGNYDGQYPQNVGKQVKGRPGDVWHK
ncbi:hypothetical protein QQS21_005291 [Conoideocrella luteorostrata]|uniref:SCP domain-containing protein n=1 Tax=Conoideocrella luteorostrata TaxID=1105319 RepID=A0AAJ0CQT0_9HYPO|nr:hypothetical protein QQS21_005291 [Conoideocrella luteorostrata]